jgi:hypothetical protein
VNQLRQHIKNVLVEENQNKKVNLVKQMIYDLFDEVSFIEQSTYDERPLLKIYFDSDSNAANIDTWFDNEISEEIRELTNDNIIVCPYWKPDWNWEKKEADIFIDSKKLKYDNSGNVINESEKKKKLEKPIKYFYKNFLHEQPVEYKGIILQPNYHEEYDVITWIIENPEDYSFNGELIKEVVVDEFRDFCSLVSLDFYGLYKQMNVIENMPNGRYYLNKNDENFIETTLKNKKYLEFDANKSQYMLNFEFVRYQIYINSDTIEIATSGYFEGVKINEDGQEEQVDGNFIEEMTDHEYDDFREYFLFNDFYAEVLNRLRANPRFYDPRIDMFDLNIWPLRSKD